MNRLKLGVAVAGASLLYGCGPSASHPESAPVTRTPAISPEVPSQSPGGPTIPNVNPRRFGKLASAMETRFEHQVHHGSVQMHQILNACSVIAYHSPIAKQESVAVVANPAALSELDKKTNTSISIAVGYNDISHSFVYGPIRLARPSPTGTETKTLTGTSSEEDLFPPGMVQNVGMVAVHWSASKNKPVDDQGNPVMDIAGYGFLTASHGINDYAGSQVAELPCEAGILTAQQRDSPTPTT